jgi:hypothetical protein
MRGGSRPGRFPRGSGPGALTPDGRGLKFYALLPPRGEPEIVHAAVPKAPASWSWALVQGE